MKALVFDCETRPADDHLLRRLCPEFDESSVKVGRLGEEKRLAKIEAAREKHFADFRDGSTLKAQTCNICAIGYKHSAESRVSLGSEKDLLEEFWRIYSETRRRGGKMIGHNVRGFDLPIIRRRSFVLGVDMPSGVIDKNRYWSSVFEDTMEVWSCGTYPPDKISLDAASKILGGPGKAGKGQHFHLLLAEGKTEEAVAYVTRDLDETWRFAAALGLLEISE